MRVHPNGFWEGADVDGEHCFDPALNKWIAQFFLREGAQSLIEFGCGRAEYSQTLAQSGIAVRAFDGNPNTPELTDGFASVLDLTTPFSFEPADWVLCLEVGEHIPKEHEATLIDAIHRHSVKGVLLSWAIVGQGGTGHVNCQDNDYIIGLFEKLGYKYDADASESARVVATLSWFRKTIMIFRKG